ncbi:phosphatase PAP2 family protein [Legionella hackeliae]|uniref:Inositolphosphotransferase Aur1/Ipt1 domain-containing protein n=1 Tax=Legionella hackeliae TaxID=449 RepID=A0A0A8USW6_LEGHA|nr:phosphatase PAP2 family protein [Legionella hackeliae]KTD13883.1 hypothetical protein Lhac_0727 [Legionella hackeliae]CEK10586.1 conserved membrane protein of unknown function [Legionella hackeliae]STX47328.1 Uncharacterised protein [Legionella hackeliae]
MSRNSNHCSIIAAFALSLLATIALVINHLFYKFPGNNYFPPNILLIALILFLGFLGSYLQFGRSNMVVKMTRELIYYFLVMSVIAFATNAIQYTPFTPIDDKLFALEAAANINLVKIVAWTQRSALFTQLLVYIYDSLPYQMSILPLVAIIMRKFSYLREYYCLLLISSLIGFTIYYFYPTVAPATFFKSELFSPEQYATGIKFSEIHQHIPPSTIDGGMIAFPSFHAIWAWLCLYLMRWSRFIFFLLLPINLLLIASCVLLGWHYPIDLIASGLILAVTHYLCFFCAKK